MVCCPQTGGSRSASRGIGRRPKNKGRGSKQKMGAGWQTGQQAKAARAAGKPAPEAARNCRTVVSCACRVFLTRLTVSAPPRAFLASSVLSVHA